MATKDVADGSVIRLDGTVWLLDRKTSGGERELFRPVLYDRDAGCANLYGR